jgi:hypothetical protein
MPRQKPLNCGNETHPLECLCDVIITQPTKTTATIPYDIKYGEAVCEHLGLGVPWSGADLADFFEGLAKVQDMARRPSLWGERKVQERGSKYHIHALKKMNEEQFAAMKQMIVGGMNPTPIVRRMNDDYGIVLTKSYISKTRQRMQFRGEYNVD